MSSRDSRFWMETDRPTVFTKAATGCGWAEWRRGGDAHFRSFQRFFLTPSPSVLRRSEKRKGRNTASWSPPPPPPTLPRRFWKEGLSQNTSTCSCVWTLLFRICMPACHLRRRLVSCSLTRSQLIPVLHFLRPLSRNYELVEIYKNVHSQKDVIHIKSIRTI